MKARTRILAAAVAIATTIPLAPAAGAMPLFGSSGLEILFDALTGTSGTGNNKVVTAEKTSNEDVRYVEVMKRTDDDWQQAYIDTTIRLLNEKRAEAGFQPVEVSPRLMEGADMWSRHMAVTGNFNHSRMDVWENILKRYDFGDIARADAPFQQWWRSTQHRYNMMHHAVRYIGVAFVKDDNGYIYGTMQLDQRP